MKVLDIHPDSCWSLEANNPAALDRLRSATSLVDPERRQAALVALKRSGHAYHLIGRATSLDLADRVFDDVVMHYSPSVAERAILIQRGSRWVKKPEKLWRALARCDGASLEPRPVNTAGAAPMCRNLQRWIKSWSPSYAR